MITFKEFISSTTVRRYTGKNGFYAWLNVAQDSLEDILKYFSDIKFTTEQLVDLHVTVMYSNTPIPVSCVNENKKMPDATFIQSVRAKELEFWGGHSGKGFLVLKLDASYIKHLHEKWVKCGAKPTFPEYTPHMTMITPCDDTSTLKKLIEKYNEKLNKEPLQITLIQEQCEDVNED
jgi:hypothetical protein